MAREVLTIHPTTDAGVDHDGNMTVIGVEGVSFSNVTGRALIIVKAVTACILTIQTTKTFNGLAVADRVIAIPAGHEVTVGVFDASIYNQADSSVYVDSDQDDTSIIALSI